MKGKKKKKNKGRIWIVLFLISVFVLFAVIYIMPTVSDAFVQTYVAEYGGLEVTDDATCYLVRKETVYCANRAGTVTYYAKEGEKIRKHTKVLGLSVGAPSYSESPYQELTDRLGKDAVVPDQYVSQTNGLVSYCIDGYEGMFTPENFKKLQKSQVEALDDTVLNLARSTTLAGEPLYKIVDNSLWYAILWADDEDIVKYKKDGTITLRLPLGDVLGTTEDILDVGEDGWLIVLRFNRYYPDMQKVRKVDATVVTEDYKGLIIQNQSIAVKKGKAGVYVKDVDGGYTFKPIKAITSNGEETLIENTFFYEKATGGAIRVETVDVYDEILKNGKV